MNDPIVEEVRKVREAHAAQFHYDLDAIFREIKEQEKKSGRTFVSFAPRKIEPNPARQPDATAFAAPQPATASEATPATER